MKENLSPILMTEEYWRNSQLSIARFYGRCRAYGHEYIVVNQEDKDLFQLTAEANRQGRAMAIPAGEPADLLRSDFHQLYRQLGRDKFIEVLKSYPHADDKELKQHMKTIAAEVKEAKAAKKEKQEPTLFND